MSVAFFQSMGNPLENGQSGANVLLHVEMPHKPEQESVPPRMKLRPKVNLAKICLPVKVSFNFS